MARAGAFCAITGVYNESAFGMFNHPGQDLQRAYSTFVAEDVELALKRRATFTRHFCADFIQAFPVASRRHDASKFRMRSNVV